MRNVRGRSTSPSCELPSETNRRSSLEKRTGEKYFAEVFSERRLGLLKTDPGYYRKALCILGGRPGETVSVGDTPLSDIRPAKLAGIRTIWVNRYREEKPSSPEQQPDYEVRDLREAVRIISLMD